LWSHAKKNPKTSRYSLATGEVQERRKYMSEKRGNSGTGKRNFTETKQTYDDNRNETLEGIAEEGEEPNFLTSTARNIRGSDVAAASAAKINAKATC
jgi:hypothetical protein